MLVDREIYVMNDIFEKYMMLTSESITHKARTVEYGHIAYVMGYETLYEGLGKSISCFLLEDRLVII